MWRRLCTVSRIQEHKRGQGAVVPQLVKSEEFRCAVSFGYQIVIRAYQVRQGTPLESVMILDLRFGAI